MSILFFDTETTGRLVKGLPVGSEKQVRLVELAFLYDDGTNGRILAQGQYYIKPKGYVVPDETARFHGITTEIAERHGVSMVSALGIFWHFFTNADKVVAHNIEFDQAIIENELALIGKALDFTSKAHCTMKQATPVCKLPGKYGHKWPTLDEAYRILVDGDGFTGAHQAMSDVTACRALYYKLNPPEIG